MRVFTSFLAILEMLGGGCFSLLALGTILVPWTSVWSYETNEISYATNWRDLDFDVTPPVLVRAVGAEDLITVVLTVDEPLETDPLLSAAEDPFGYTLEETGGGEVLVFASAVVSNSVAGTQVVLELVSPRDPAKTYDLVVLAGGVTDRSGNAIESPNNIIRMIVFFTSEVLGFHDVWEYHQSAVDPGDWLNPAAPAFPNTGAGLLGQETAGGSVPLIMTDLISTAEGSGTFSYYFRTRFFIDDLVSVEALTMRYFVDDAAVIYLNGMEVYRTDYEGQVIPGKPGDPIPFGTQPPGTVRNAELTPPDSDPPIHLPIGSLVEGENTISVYNGQGGGNSPDVVWGCRLEIVGLVVNEAPVIVVPPIGVMVGEWESFSLRVRATHGPLTYQWIRDGVELPGENGPSISRSPAVPSDSGMYWVRVSNSFGEVSSAPVQVTVHNHVLPPVILDVVAAANRTNITVTFDKPVAELTATNTANYTVVEGVTGYPLPVVGASIDSSGQVVTLTTEPIVPLTSYNLTVSGVQDRAESPNTIVTVTVRVMLTVPIFTTGHFWSYDERDVDLGTGWRGVEYDDSAWPRGPSILGYEGNLTIATPLQQTFPGNPRPTVTYYFRTHFLSYGEPATASLVANVRFDDGFILYLNGVEAARRGFIGEAFHTNLFESHESTEMETVEIDNAGLVYGDNVLAVEVHQTSYYSADLVWDMELVQLVEEIIVCLCPPAAVVSIAPASGIIPEGGTALFTVSAVGARPQVFQWYKVGLGDLPGETGSTLVIANATPADDGVYGVRVSNAEGTTEANAPLALTVLGDLFSPTVRSCVAGVGGGTITIEFDKVMDAATVEDIAHYTIAAVGSGDLPVSVAELAPDGRTVELTTGPPTLGVNYTVTIADVRDATFKGNLIDPNPSVCDLDVELIGAGHVWSYEESDTDLPDDWLTVSYDDSGWPAGPGILGYEANLTIATPLQRVYVSPSGETNLQGTSTYYFRTHFYGAGHVDGNDLRFLARFDDGFVAYLNGVEVARYALPDGPVLHGDRAYAHESDMVEDLPVSDETLLPGDNVLAVELHQQNLNSSDAVWDLRILSSAPRCVAGDSVIVANGDGTVTITWDDRVGAELWSSASVEGRYSNTGGSSPYSFTPAVGGRVFYQVVCP